MGEGERIGPGPVIGHLTSATSLEPGGVYDARGAVDLRADAEVGLRLRADVDPDASREDAQAAIAGFGAALELVDLGDSPVGAERIVETNVWHRAYALGPLDRSWPLEGVEGRLVVADEVRVSARADADYPDLVRTVARLLGEMGERLLAGDCLITGSVVQVPIEPGDEVIADLGPLGRTQLTAATVFRR
jgi:2-keto-4-pentenoate hydratase